MNRNVGNFRAGYSPGGRITPRRERARRAGVRSGVVRRQLRDLHGPRRALRVAQLGPDAFEAEYRAMCDREGLAFDRRGLNSCHVYYVALMTRYRAQGNGYETTNAQSCAAMAAKGRPRSRRTVQRLRGRLRAMGLLDFHHVKRSGRDCRRGELDSLRVICLHQRRRRANDTLRSWSEPALKGRRLRRKTFVAPPSAADDVGPRFAVPGSEERHSATRPEPVHATEAERRLAYLELCEAHAPTLLSASDRQELERLRAGGSGQGTCSIESRTWAGER